MHILGISAFYHDSAACLVTDGKIVAAAQEERFTRKKHDFGFPAHAIRSCLREAGITGKELSYVAFYERPHLKFDRILATHLSNVPRGLSSYLTSMKLWVTKKAWIRDTIREEMGYDGRILFPEHHESHAASAFFPSPFDEAAILTIDGVGEWATTTIGVGEGNRIRLLKELRFPHSLGLLYSAFTYYTGFRVNSGEYKVMGLAPYGEPRYVDTILTHLVDLKPDGSFRLNTDYFGFVNGFTMTNGKFHELFGGPPREPESPLTQREMDLARSVQDVTEEIMLRMAREARALTGKDNLCLAGGVALNCVANGKIWRSGLFRDLWIQPGAGDAGGAVGAALLVWYSLLGNPRISSPSDAMMGAYLGPRYSDAGIEAFLGGIGAPYTKLSDDELIERAVSLLAEGKVIGWFQDRMEFGPRALGARSIIADSRNPEMQKKLNLKIKFRESFRPFAPSVPREDVSRYFELDHDSPYMLLVARVQPGRCIPMTDAENRLFGIERLNLQRSDIPAVTHVDYSARLQTVHRETNPRYHRLLEAFRERTGCSVLVNTSFNVRGEPIVCTPEDAYRCFMRTEMDYLVMGNILLDKRDQPPSGEDTSWQEIYRLD